MKENKPKKTFKIKVGNKSKEEVEKIIRVLKGEFQKLEEKGE